MKTRVNLSFGNEENGNDMQGSSFDNKEILFVVNFPLNLIFHKYFRFCVFICFNFVKWHAQIQRDPHLNSRM